MRQSIDGRISKLESKQPSGKEITTIILAALVAPGESNEDFPCSVYQRKSNGSWDNKSYSSLAIYNKSVETLGSL